MATTSIPNLLNAVSAVIHDKRFAHSSFEDALAFLVEYAAAALDCQRVSVWEYHRTPAIHIQCLDIWEKKEKTHSRGTILGEAEASTITVKRLQTGELFLGATGIAFAVGSGATSALSRS